MPSSVYHAVVRQKGNWWIGWIQEIPGVNCQEQTREELIDTLETAPKEYALIRFRLEIKA